LIGQSGDEGIKPQPNAATTSATQHKMDIYNCSNSFSGNSASLPFLFKCSGRLLAQRAVRSILVVLHSPLFDLTSCPLYTLKPILIQALCSQLSIEALYVPIIHRFPRPTEFQLDSFPIGPFIYHLRGKFRPVVHPD
jgi:hypothetical protein